MKKEDVPQDYGMGGEQLEVCYAVDENGHYVLAPSLGWKAKNVTNQQAWGLIKEKIDDAIRRVKTGQLSPLAYHMAKNQMDVGLLAKYVGFYSWRVKRHLKPTVFKRLSPDILQQYADLFDITTAQLREYPESADLALAEVQSYYEDKI
jgi:hypothetical protein|tara:strand:- start:65 stop:511 length:447 start_codon:yes stop_codon:yes gene_type:complete